MDNISPTPARPELIATPMAVIRVALLAGVLLFGGVTWWLQRQGTLAVAPEQSLSVLRTAGAGLWGLVIVAVIALFTIIRRRQGTGAVITLKIVAWGMGEAVALFGGVYWFLSGDPHWYVYGIVFFCGVLMLFPTRTE